MSGPLPRNEWELDIAIAKETPGGFSEGLTRSISSNSITPTESSHPVDATGGGTIKTIDITNIKDGQVIYIGHCVENARDHQSPFCPLSLN